LRLGSPWRWLGVGDKSLKEEIRESEMDVVNIFHFIN
jgi:hypothetical protein